MPREQIVLQAGQCGNQVGYMFWQALCREHQINADGTDAQAAWPGESSVDSGPIRGTFEGTDLENKPKRANTAPYPTGGELISQRKRAAHYAQQLNASRQMLDMTREAKHAFFYQADDGRYIPRSVMLDLEPRVISTIYGSEHGRLFNREASFLPPHGSGAGNTWASGYSQAEEHTETILELINRECEGSDSLEGFLLFHSVAGGTGSGMGSCLLEQLHDYFPKKLRSACSVFPNQLESSDVVVQPYNTILTLKRLTQNADCVYTLDNSSLARIVNEQLHVSDPSMDLMNHLVSSLMASATYKLRFPENNHASLASMYSALIPTHPLHYLVPSTSALQPLAASSTSLNGSMPLSSVHSSPAASDLSASHHLHNQQQQIIKTSAMDVLRRLMHQTNTAAVLRPAGRYISGLVTLQSSDFLNTDINQAMRRLQTLALTENKPALAQEIPVSFQVHPIRPLPHLTCSHKVTGFMLANHTGVVSLFEKTVQQYSKLRRANAFLDQFRKENAFKSGLEEFDDSKEAVVGLIEAYKAIDQPQTKESAPQSST